MIPRVKNLILAASDSVAIDAIAAQLMGFDPLSIPFLRMAHERLNPEWIVDWMKSPLKILPGTRMPAFWPDYPKSFYPHLNGDAEAQIRAIRDYMLTFRGGPSPTTNGARAANND